MSLPERIATDPDNHPDQEAEKCKTGLPEVKVVIALEDDRKGLPIVSSRSIHRTSHSPQRTDR